MNISAAAIDRLMVGTTNRRWNVTAGHLRFWWGPDGMDLDGVLMRAGLMAVRKVDIEGLMARVGYVGVSVVGVDCWLLGWRWGGVGVLGSYLLLFTSFAGMVVYVTSGFCRHARRADDTARRGVSVPPTENYMYSYHLHGAALSVRIMEISASGSDVGSARTPSTTRSMSLHCRTRSPFNPSKDCASERRGSTTLSRELRQHYVPGIPEIMGVFTQSGLRHTTRTSNGRSSLWVL